MPSRVFLLSSSGFGLVIRVGMFENGVVEQHFRLDCFSAGIIDAAAYPVGFGARALGQGNNFAADQVLLTASPELIRSCFLVPGQPFARKHRKVPIRFPTIVEATQSG